MSALSLRHPTAPVSWRRRLLARVTVAAARPVAGWRPGRLRRALQWLRRGARPATAAEVQASLDAVLTVSVRCRGEYCLQRSIAAAMLCRLTGSWPQWHAGARTRPFQGHAWLGVDGAAVGEPPEVLAGLATVITVAPVDAERCP